MAGYDPSQPRIPRGQHGGGEFGKKSGGPKAPGGEFGKGLHKAAIAIGLTKEVKKARAHRATGNPRGRPPSKMNAKELAAHLSGHTPGDTTKAAHPVPPHPSITVPKTAKKTGFTTGNPHTDAVIANTALKAGSTLGHGLLSAGIAHIAGSSAASIGSNGRDTASGMHIVNPEAPVEHRGPGRPRTTGGLKPAPIVKFNVGFTAYRKHALGQTPKPATSKKGYEPGF